MIDGRSYARIYARLRKRKFSAIAANNTATAILRDRERRTLSPAVLTRPSWVGFSIGRTDPRFDLPAKVWGACPMAKMARAAAQRPEGARSIDVARGDAPTETDR